MLGFRPAGTPNGQYPTLKTIVKGDRGYTIEARAGYFDEKSPQETVQQRIDRIVLSDDMAYPFPATLQVTYDLQRAVAPSVLGRNPPFAGSTKASWTKHGVTVK